MKLGYHCYVHGNFDALCAVLADISKRWPDIIVNLGCARRNEKCLVEWSANLRQEQG
jgi:hypothetical protein